MLSRFAGRLVTGPLAFLVAGVIDLSAFLLACLWIVTVRRVARLRGRLRLSRPS